MRPVMIYTMLTIAIIRAVEGAGSASAPQLAPGVAGAPAIGAVKLEATRLVTSVNRAGPGAAGAEPDAEVARRLGG
jgi:hypothetical protein